MNSQQRIVGIRHRTKRTAEQEARPTQVFILTPGKEPVTHDLATETDELDYVKGVFPVKWRKIRPDDDISVQPRHQVRWARLNLKKMTPAQLKQYPPHHLRKEGKEMFVATQIPIAFDGLQAGDTVAMVLGGSGDNLAYALARRGEQIGATVVRIPPFQLKSRREAVQRKTDDDAQTLAETWQEQAELFTVISPRDRQLIRLREALYARVDAMKARLACEQRLRQRLIGKIFCRPDGFFPEGAIEDMYDEAKANDKILAVLEQEQRQRERELQQVVEELDVYEKLFSPIEGCGVMIASRIIAGVQDIRRFSTQPKFKAFCGVHVLSDGRFVRRRSNEVANWHPDVRQALYLIGDQFNRRPKSVWGQKLLSYKAKLRQAHPEVVVGENGKKRYTDIHIHKMALWRTLTKFVEWLYDEWWHLERAAQAERQADAA